MAESYLKVCSEKLRRNWFLEYNLYSTSLKDMVCQFLLF